MSNLAFHQLYPEIHRKVQASTVATCVMSRYKAPRDVIVSASIYGCRLTHQTLETGTSFLEKG